MWTRRAFGQFTLAAALAAPPILRAAPLRRAIVVGAGAAGLTGAYHLIKAGVEVRILEAAPRWGGRVKRLSGFADVPLDLGAEWLHDRPTILGEILGRRGSSMGVDTIAYDPQTFQFWHQGRLRDLNMLRHVYEEVKFRNTTWYGFFERFVLPQVAQAIRLNAQVTGIGRTGSGISLRLRGGEVMEADQVLITVPISVLQRGGLTFGDGLPAQQLRQLADIPFGSGFKVFMKFKERFYPDVLLEGSRAQVMMVDEWASKIYYDAALRKPTRDNILGLFTVSPGRLTRAELSDVALVHSALDELSGIFGSAVRAGFQGARVQNWSREPHIWGSYSMSDESNRTHQDILTPIEGRVHFAGEFLGGDARSTVHGAAFSAIRAVAAMQAA